MRIFKLFAGCLVLLIIGLFIHQNLATFKSPVTFSLDLFIREKVTGQFSLYSLLLFVGIVGVLLGVFLMLKPYFSARRLLAQERHNRQGPPPADERIERSEGPISPKTANTSAQNAENNSETAAH